MSTLRTISFLLLLTWATASQAGERSSAVRKKFLLSLGLTRTPRGCQVDHIRPLHCGGADAIANLQLLCGAVLQEKERQERHCDTLPAWLQQCAPQTQQNK